MSQTFTNPVRLEVQKRLSALLSTITPANGYVTDLSGSVYRGRNIFGDGDPLPMVSILEEPIPPEQLPGPPGFVTGDWNIMIQGFAVDDRENPTDPAHILMADVKRCLGEEARKFDSSRPEDGCLGIGNTVLSIAISPGVVRPPDEISSKAYFWLSVGLEMSEDATRPYEG